jgi:tetratricopeptide (TPR) repeat protein
MATSYRDFDLEANLAACREEVAQNPKDPAAHDKYGLALFEGGRFAQAAASFRTAVALDSNVATYHEHLGQALLDNGQTTDGAASLRTALSIDPNRFLSLLLLAHLMQTAGRLPEAIHFFQRAIESDPLSYQAHLRYSNALMQAGDTSGAEAQVRVAVSLDPRNFLAHEFLGEVLQVRGDFDEAVAAFEQAIVLNPEPRATSFQGLVAAKKITPADLPRVEQMLAMAATPDLSAKDELILHLSLGKAWDDLGDYEAAFRQFESARSCAKRMHQDRPFDRRAIAHTVEVCKTRFTKGAISGYSHGVKSDLPILIVGMPRSGTTLLDQIISSHPEVGSAGELNFWRESPLALNVAKVFEPAFANDLAVRYRMLLRGIGPAKRRVIDKMPLNFPFLGAVHMLFPNARLLHCRRHPVDTCLSMLMNTLTLSESSSYLFDVEDTVFIYQEYLRVMEHWREVLPADRFLEVDYEEVVSNPELMTRKIIAFCGLGWDEACLHHERNRRTIETPSKWQVRQPIYSSSVARWKNYEPWLGALRELLTDSERGHRPTPPPKGPA